MSTVIAITPSYIYPGEARAIEAKLAGGEADYIHIRKPDAETDEIRRLLTEIAPQYRGRLALHSHFNMAEELGLGGVHLNSHNPEPPKGWKGRVSRSCHSLGELMDTAGLDYVFLSPIYPSFSKPGYSSGILADPALARSLADAPAPVIALGGVRRTDLPALEEAGFAGIAMLYEAWRSPAMRLDRFRLQLITHPLEGQSIVEGACKALAGGCRWIQLRHKDAVETTVEDEAKEIALLPGRENFTLIIDDYVELVNVAGADGVHLGRKDMPVRAARLLLGPSKIIGATANTLADMVEAARDGADYIGLGPFRFTTTKAGLSPVLGLEGYTRLVAEAREAGVQIPIVAIGGITLDDVEAIMDTGADGVAVSGAILTAPDPSEATAAFLAKIRNQESGIRNCLPALSEMSDKSDKSDFPKP